VIHGLKDGRNENSGKPLERTPRNFTLCYRIPHLGAKTCFGNSLAGCLTPYAHLPAKPFPERCTRFLKRPIRELAG
jgi:hypothetical protein